MSVVVATPYGDITFPESAERVYAFQDSAEEHLIRHVELIRERYHSFLGVIDTFTPRSLVDIGSGLAVIDIFFGRNGSITNIHLLDGDGTEKKINGFHAVTPAWYSVDIGFEVVRSNVSEGVLVHKHYAHPSVEVSVDLIISTRAWGHHFPINTYLDLAKRSLNGGGCIIVDIRRKSDGYNEMLGAGFRMHQELPAFSHKCSRFVFVRK